MTCKGPTAKNDMTLAINIPVIPPPSANLRRLVERKPPKRTLPGAVDDELYRLRSLGGIWGEESYPISPGDVELESGPGEPAAPRPWVYRTLPLLVDVDKPPGL